MNPGFPRDGGSSQHAACISVVFSRSATIQSWQLLTLLPSPDGFNPLGTRSREGNQQAHYEYWELKTDAICMGATN